MPSRSRLKIRRKIEFPSVETIMKAKEYLEKNDPIYSILLVEQCKGCAHAWDSTCSRYRYPESKWEAGKTCPMATHIKKEVKKNTKSIDPIKASKAKAKGK